MIPLFFCFKPLLFDKFFVLLEHHKFFYPVESLKALVQKKQTKANEKTPHTKERIEEQTTQDEKMLCKNTLSLKYYVSKKDHIFPLFLYA